MTFWEFQEKVGTISLLVTDSEYNQIFTDYNRSDLHKDEFLNDWREAKKNSLHQANRQTPQMDRAAFFGQGVPFTCPKF